ncbi:MAG: glycosyltransferase family 4 protein, partial [Steroidobacteraceae bacterium]
MRAGHTVTIVAASQSHVRNRQPAMEGVFTVELVEGVRFVWCATPRYDGNGFGRVVNIVAFLLRLGQLRRWLDVEPDVVIASSTYPLDIGPAQRLAQRHAATLIWEVHDLWPLSPIELGGMSRSHPFIRWLQHAEDRACRVSDRVVSMLPMADLHLISRGMDRSKFVHIPNGIDPDEWVEAAAVALPVPHQEVIQKLREAGSKLVCYAGAHGVANALPTLLEAARLCTDDMVTFILVGTGPDKPALRDRAMRDGLRNVVFLDPVPKASIP